MNYRAMVLIVLQLTALVGYATTAGNSQPANRQIIDLQVRIIGFNGKELHAGPGIRRSDLYLKFALLPGNLHTERFLPFLDETLYLEDRSPIPLDLGHLAERLAPKATSASETGSPEFAVTPKETRFARLLPGISFTTSQNVKMKEGFYDADTRDTLMLVYFDRPCHVSGVDTGSQPKPIDSPPRIDIEVDAPGWVWIETKKTGQSTYVEVRAPSPHPVLLITPNDGDLYLKYQEGAL